VNFIHKKESDKTLFITVLCITKKKIDRATRKQNDAKILWQKLLIVIRCGRLDVFVFTFYRILGSENYWMSSGLLSIRKRPARPKKKGLQRNLNDMIRNRLILASFLVLMTTGTITACQNSLTLSQYTPSASDGALTGDQRSRASIADHTSVNCQPECFLMTTGVASYYADRFQGRTTANGETFDMNDLTAAHKSLPFGTWVR